MLVEPVPTGQGGSKHISRLEIHAAVMFLLRIKNQSSDGCKYSCTSDGFNVLFNVRLVIKKISWFSSLERQPHLS